ncbi:MAG TPA: hypothetical protein VFL57_04910 [Bryobacteraceae bacterium]|nr:hypothetical protein [Bryobacteraceae bacterium]
MLIKREICTLAGALLVATASPAEEQDVLKQRVQKQAIERQVLMRGPAGVSGAVEFISSEMLAGQVVKGAPYSAEAVTESVQTLADGNRITRRSTAAVARDSEGRTRRESELSAIGPLAAADAPRLAFIHDPVANAHYILDAKTLTARKMAVKHSVTADGHGVTRTFDVRVAGPAELRDHIVISGQPAVQERLHAGEVKEEDLGTRNVEGVLAKGTRRIVTIPAGQIGNDRPIEIVSERWYSPELQTIVYSSHNDPRTGETIYRLTRISRSEPLKSLFEVPGDYKVVEPGEMKHIEMKVRNSSR